MIRKYVSTLLTAVMLAVIPAIAQGAWSRTYGGQVDETAWSVQPTLDDGYIVAATTNSFGEGGDDCWLLKTDAQGDTLWTCTFGTEYDDWGFFAQQTSDGEYAIIGTKTSVKEGDKDFWLIKTDSAGDLLWERSYGGPDHDYASWGQQTSDGGYILAGLRDRPKAGCGYTHAWLVKTDSLGDTLWSRIYGLWDVQGNAYHVQETSDGGFVFTGSLDSDLFLCKVDSEGDSLWAKTYDCFGFQDDGYCVQETSDGEYIVTGIACEDNEYENSKAWLLKTDAQGDTLWTRTFFGEKGAWGHCVQVTPDGGYILTGTKDFPFSDMGGDLFIMKTDSLGNELWTRTYGNQHSDHGSFIQMTSDGGFIIAGSTAPLYYWDSDIWLIKTDSLGNVAVTEPITHTVAQPDWQLISTIGSQIVLRYEDRPEGFHARVFDASGRKVDEIFSTDVSGTLTWGEGYCPGVYFIQSIEERASAIQKVILIR